MLLSFRNQGDLVYLEDVGSSRYVRDRDEVARYALTFDHLRASALADDKSAELIKEIMRDGSWPDVAEVVPLGRSR